MRPMKAATYVEGMELRFPMLASPKLDGIRCMLVKGAVLSAQMKPIPNAHVRKLLGRLELNGLDGELIVGDPWAKDCYRRTVSAVMSTEGTPDVHLYTFDMWSLNAPFQDRVKAYSSPARRMFKVLHPLSQTLLHDMDGLKAYEEGVLGLGYEGVMLRDPLGPYKQGRSTPKEGYLFKVKRFVDDEAEIMEVVELEHNLNEAKEAEDGRMKRASCKCGKVCGGTMGALVVKCKSFKAPFSIGTGFTADDREYFWKFRNDVVGMRVVFKYFPVGVKDAPRHPTYKGLRAVID